MSVRFGRPFWGGNGLPVLYSTQITRPTKIVNTIVVTHNHIASIVIKSADRSKNALGFQDPFLPRQLQERRMCLRSIYYAVMWMRNVADELFGWTRWISAARADNRDDPGINHTVGRYIHLHLQANSSIQLLFPCSIVVDLSPSSRSKPGMQFLHVIQFFSCKCILKYSIYLVSMHKLAFESYQFCCEPLGMLFLKCFKFASNLSIILFLSVLEMQV